MQPSFPKKINTFFDRSFQLGIVTNPYVLAGEGFRVITGLVPELLGLNAAILARKAEDDIADLAKERIGSIASETLRQEVAKACEMGLLRRMAFFVRVEVVISMHCGDLQAMIRFFKKNDSTDHWIWELSFNQKGLTRSSLTGSEH